MNLYRVVVTTTTEYLVKAEAEDSARFFARTLQGTGDYLMKVSVTESKWAEPVRIVGEEYSA